MEAVGGGDRRGRLRRTGRTSGRPRVDAARWLMGGVSAAGVGTGTGALGAGTLAISP